MRNHSWSGWPGAYCLNCLENDPSEQCLGLGCITTIHCTCKSGCDECCHTGVLRFEVCALHQSTECAGAGKGKS